MYLPINKPASPSGIFWRDTRTPVRRSSQAWPTQLPAAQRGPRTRWSRRSHNHPHCPTPGSGWSARWGPSPEPHKSCRSWPALGSWAPGRSCPPWSRRSGSTAASCMRCRTGSSTRAALHSEHLQNPMMDGNGELHTCHRTSHIKESRIPPPYIWFDSALEDEFNARLKCCTRDVSSSGKEKSLIKMSISLIIQCSFILPT